MDHLVDGGREASARAAKPPPAIAGRRSITTTSPGRKTVERIDRDHRGRRVRLAVVLPAVLAVLASATPAAVGDRPAQSEPRYMELTLADAIMLALENNRGLINARLGRELDRIALEEVEDEFRPQARATIGVPLSIRSRMSGDDRSSASDIETTFDSSITMKVPTGGRATFEWEQLENQRAGGGTSLQAPP